MTTQTHYQTLGVSPEATQAEIKKAYRTLIRQAHPDLAGPQSAARAAQLSAAYEVLSDPDHRSRYDQTLARPDPSADDEFVDAWGQPGAWDEDEEVLDDVEVDLGDGPPVPPAVHYDPAPTATPGAPLQEPPPAPAPSDGGPVFVPPLQRPVIRSRRPRWITWWVIGFSVPAALTVLAVLIGVILTADSGGDPMLLVMVIIFWAAVIGAPPLLHRLTTPKPTVPPQLATDLLPEPVLQQQIHGPTEGEAAARTISLLRTSVLPSYPGARLVNGFHRPGVDPGLVDHVLIAGRTMIIISSLCWQDGPYRWDGARLQYEGRELAPFQLGVAVERLRHAFPGVAVIGAVVLHSPSGRLDRPLIENAPLSPSPIGGHGVPVLNPAGLIDFVHGVLRTVPDRDVVDVNLMTHLLGHR